MLRAMPEVDVMTLDVLAENTWPYLCVRWPWADRYLREARGAVTLTEPFTMGRALLMRMCWQRDDAGQEWCHR